MSVNPNAAPSPVDFKLPIAEADRPTSNNDPQNLERIRLNTLMEVNRRTKVLQTGEQDQHGDSIDYRMVELGDSVPVAFDGIIRSMHAESADVTPSVRAIAGNESIRGKFTDILITTDAGERLLISRTSGSHVEGNRGRAADPTKGDEGEEGQTFTLINLDQKEGIGSKDTPRMIDSTLLAGIVATPGEQLVLNKDPGTDDYPRSKGNVQAITLYELDEVDENGGLVSKRLPQSSPYRRRGEVMIDPDLKEAMRARREREAAPAVGGSALQKTVQAPEALPQKSEAEQQQEQAKSFIERGLQGNFAESDQLSPNPKRTLEGIQTLIEAGDQESIEDVARVRELIQQALTEARQAGTDTSTAQGKQSARNAIINRFSKATEGIAQQLETESDPAVKANLTRRLFQGTIALAAYNITPVKTPVGMLLSRLAKYRLNQAR